MAKVPEAVEEVVEAPKEKKAGPDRRHSGPAAPVALQFVQAYAASYVEHWIAQQQAPMGPGLSPQSGDEPPPARGRAIRVARPASRDGPGRCDPTSHWRRPPDDRSYPRGGNRLTADAEQVKEQALEFAASASERLAEGVEAVKHFTLEPPARALGIALGMGVVLGWLIKRR